MTDPMFELPDFEPKGKFTVTDKVARGEERLLLLPPTIEKKSA